MVVVVLVGDGDALEGGLEVGDVHGVCVCVRCGAGLCWAVLRGERKNARRARALQAMQRRCKQQLNTSTACCAASGVPGLVVGSRWAMGDGRWAEEEATLCSCVEATHKRRWWGDASDGAPVGLIRRLSDPHLPAAQPSARELLFCAPSNQPPPRPPTVHTLQAVTSSTMASSLNGAPLDTAAPGHAETSITQKGFKITTRKLPILKAGPIDDMTKKLGIAPPEMIFGDNFARIEHLASGWSIDFNAFDALDLVDKTGDSMLKVSYSKEWQQNR